MEREGSQDRRHVFPKILPGLLKKSRENYKMRENTEPAKVTVAERPLLLPYPNCP